MQAVALYFGALKDSEILDEMKLIFWLRIKRIKAWLRSDMCS
jgi:hypothetical protein